MAAYDDFLGAFKGQLQSLANTDLKDFASTAVSDGEAFLKQSEADLKTWTQKLAAKTLSLQDFQYLVQGKKDLAIMVGLQKAGLAQAKLDQFTNGVLGAVISSATKTFLN